MRAIHLAAPAGFVLLAIAGASGIAGAQAGVTRRDSLGIVIHESRTLGPRVVASEVQRIGAVNGPPESTFFQIADAHFGPDGTLIVLDGGDHVVKVFDASGRFVTRFGGSGEGPAEFSAPWLLEVRGDTVRVLDYNQRKLVTFSVNGDLLATRRLGFAVSEHGFPESFASRPGGGLFIVGVRGCGLPRRPNDNQWGLFAIGPDGAVDDTLRLEFIRNALPVYTSGRVMSCTVLPWPFAPGPAFAFDPSGGAVRSPGDVFEIRRLDASLGRVTAILRYAVPPRRISAGERRAFQDLVDARENLTRDMRRAVEAAADSAGHPEVWPAITALEVAGSGTVWARRARPIGAAEQEWDVVIDGRHVRTVVLPGGLRVTGVRGDRAVGVILDDLDVQYVAVFRIPP